MFVAIVRVTDSPGLGTGGACLTVILFAVLWFVQPLLLRARTA